MTILDFETISDLNTRYELNGKWVEDPFPYNSDIDIHCDFCFKVNYLDRITSKKADTGIKNFSF
jgi:hypothetical protein